MPHPAHLAAEYERKGCPIHHVPGGFIAAVGRHFGKTLYRVHSHWGHVNPNLVAGKDAAIAELARLMKHMDGAPSMPPPSQPR